MKRAAIHLGLIGAFIFAIALSVSPQLHERFHPDAKQVAHECAVTLIASGTYEHGVAPLPLMVEAPLVAFHQPVLRVREWVASPFLCARIFEHAPPPIS